MKQFLVLALMLCANMAWGQASGPWTPNGSGTYRLRSRGTTGNNFDVFKDGTTDTVATNRTSIGQFSITSDTCRIIFENTRTIIMTGQIAIGAPKGTGAHLIMELGTPPSGTVAHDSLNPTLRIDNIPKPANGQMSGIANGLNQAMAFYIPVQDNPNRDEHTITIRGNAPSSKTTEDIPNFKYDFSNNFVIDGSGPTLTAVDDSVTLYPKVTATGGQVVGNGMFRLQHGSLTLENVTVQKFSSSYSNACMAQVYLHAGSGYVSDSVALYLKFDHCHFNHIGGQSSTGSPVLRMQADSRTTSVGNLNRDAIIQNCLIENTFGSYSLAVGQTTPIDNANGTIRTVGNNKVTLVIKKTHMKHNYGCPVRWHGASTASKLKVDSCLIERNFTCIGSNVKGGGGLLLKGPAEVRNSIIRNNRTQGDGGGIYLSTYTDFGNGTPDLVPEHSVLDLDPGTIISNNVALKNGGGVAIDGIRMINPYISEPQDPNGPNGYIWFAPDSTAFTLKFQLGGAKVINNTALGFDLPNNFYSPSNPKAVGLGGGVFITRNEQTTYFRVECLLDKGEISGNKVKVISNDTIIKGKGGGVAIYTPDSVSNPAETPYRVKPQNVDVIIGVAEGNEKMLIQNDSADYGGGIYVEAYPLNYNGVTSQVTTTVYDHSNIDNNKAYIHGGGLYVETGTVSILKEGSYSPTFQRNSASTGDGGGVYLNRGNIDMKGATIGLDTITKGNKAGDSGGGIYVNMGTVTMLSSKVSYNQANGTNDTNGDGGGIYVNSGDVLINHKEQSTGTPSQINNNSAQRNGGGIYDLAGKVVVFGAFDGDSTYRVQISHNTATTGMGGGIYCKGDTTSSAYDIRMRRVRLEGNTSGNHGGGIYLEGGKVSIINGWLLSNTAGGGGGGVYTQIGNIDINITGEERQPSKINGNKAKKNGGGLNTKEGFITVRGKSKNDRIEIKGNVAGNDNGNGSGGGAFCLGSSDKAEYITMTHVDLADNEANGSGEETEGGSTIKLGCGGGIYLQQGVITVTDVAIQNNKAEKNGGGINNHSGNIDVNGCLIGGAEGKGNQAGNSGGGIYTNQGDIDIEDFVETAGNIQRIESKITHNTAAVNGGGADTRMGTIWVNKKEMDDQIEIAFNTAKKGGGLYANSGTIITYNALIHDNTANENGGGLNNHAGDIILHGGILTNNSALEGHGGGAYTFVGDIDLFQFPSTKLDNVTLNEGTKVFNNIAKINGGAFNNHTGRVDVRHATIYNNTATLGNGGGIFCEGPHANDNKGLGYTIRLLCSDVVQNKTRGQDGTAADPTGRGGGIYLKYGNIYAHYSNIRDNEANINGGGIDNHQGNILLYGCEVKGNRAVELDGGGIYTFEGNITTGPSTKRESPLGAKITVIENNSAHRNGGGINNQKGNIDLNGDRIASNQALNGDGGGVYIANGNITLNGGKIELNSATLGNGGGVYSGGGVFDIHEREENPDPIVLLVDAEVKRNTDSVGNIIIGEGAGQHATVHYHLVDQGKYSDIVENSVKHGIIWWKKQYENQADTVYFGETPSNYVSSQGEPACERITIPSKNDTIPQGIEPDTIYQVKAFFEYQYKNENDVTITKRGYSEEMEFVTYSAKPLVLSGAVSNITSTSAQGSGKIMDPGTSPITARGVKIWRDTIHGESTPPAPLYIPSTITTNFFTVDSLRDPANGATQLLPNQKYYACAYATNGSGTSEGNRVEFTTLQNTPYMGTNPVIVTDTIENDTIIVVTARFTMPPGSNLTNPSGNNYIKGYGFVWSTDDDPELISDHTTPGTLGSDNLTFTASYRGARQNICAYVRAYATYVENNVTNASDITDYSITTPTPHYTPYLNGAPVVRAFRITGITQNSATIHCEIYNGYVAGTTKYGVYLENYDQTANPSNPTQPNYDTAYISSSNIDSLQIYTVDLSGLIPGTTYYLKAYATNVANPTSHNDYSYGNSYNFTALPVVQPVVNIEAIDTITKVSAKVHCSVNNGGATVTNWGVKYSTNSDMTNATDVNKPGGGDQLSGNTFTVNLDNEGHNLLTEHTTYYVQAYATNSAGTHTTQAVSFTTEYDKPYDTITSIDSVTFTIGNQSQNDYTFAARVNFRIAPHSANTTDRVNTYGVCWSFLHEPSRRKSDVSNTDFKDCTPPISGADTANLRTSITQIHSNTKYYVRAYASTATAVDDTVNGVYSLNDIVYSDEASFITLPIMFTNGATATLHNAATLSGRIGSRDSEGHLVHDPSNTNPNGLYGVCWGASANPTRGQGGATNYVEQNINTSNANTFDFNLMATGLSQNTAYHYRAYSINSEGNIAYGADTTFRTREHSVTLVANPTAGGAVSGSYANLESDHYTAVATPNVGYTFTNWTEGSSVLSTDASYSFDVTSDHTLQANFTINTYTIAVAANPTGYGTVTGGGTYNYGTEVTLTATANTGYSFVNWTLNGNVVSGENNYTITVTDNANYVANFEINNYTISAIANPEEGGTVTGSGTYTYGANVTVTATASTGYNFSSMTVDGASVTPTYDANTGAYSYALTVSGNHNVVVTFTTRGGTTSGPRDIYPAPAREPWDWDEEDPQISRADEPPTVTTGTMTDLTATSATVRGIVTSAGDATSLTEAGIWWSTQGPEYDASTNAGNFVQVTPTPDVNTQFSMELTGLNGDATYYVRAYAKNSHGTGFGNLRAFSFNCLPTINHNTAENGGGIYIASGGKILFSSGDINLNEATVNGGGIYLEEGSIMHMRNICEVNGNHTPDFNLIPASNGTGKDSIVGGGAGIYLDGKLYVGENIDDPKGTHRLYVNKNYAMTSFTEAQYDLGNYDNQYYLRNNVFLPYVTDKTSNKYFDAYKDFDNHDNNKARVIVLLSDISNAENTAYSHIGFSVTKGKIPVVATAKKAEGSFNFTDYGIYTYGPTGNVDSTETWMNTITDRMNSVHSANASVFDDARAYIAIHARQDDSPFREDYIYLWDCWTTPVVKYDPALYDMYGHRLTNSQGQEITDDSHYIVDDNGLWHIKDEKGLAWFSANVNRLNGSNNENYSTLEAVLEADLDMTEYLWVPIASVRERQEGINTIFRDIDDADPNIEKLGFRGKFNGQGHLITGIDCRYISGMEKYGLFGNLEDGAVVENTFVDASRFRTNDQSKSYHVGGIAGLMEEGSTVRASEARFVVDLARAHKATSYVGGLAGQVTGTAANPAIIHSSMAMPEIQGAVDYMGGLVGHLGTYNNLLNSFSNPKFPDASYPMNPNKYVGGLVGENNGLVENCYSRLQGSEPKNSSNQSIFGWLAGTNNTNANIKYCYGAKEKMDAPGVTDGGKYIKTGTDPIGHGKYSQTLRYSGKYGFKHRDHKMHKSDGTLVESDYTKYVDAKTNDTLIGGLMNALNHWVDTANKTTPTYAKWTRTMASHINDDYPVPMLDTMNKIGNKMFNSVGSKDEIYLLYEDNINDMWTAKKFDTITKKNPRAAMYLYDVQPGTDPDTVRITGNINVPLHIHEDIGITQPANAVLTARAGVTIKNDRKDENDFTADPNWHLFSSAIQDVPIGLDYHTKESGYEGVANYQVLINFTQAMHNPTLNNGGGIPNTDYWNRNYMDPPKTTWFQSDDNTAYSYNETGSKIGYFPTNTPYGTWRSTSDNGFFDLYTYSEEFYHWVNFKREGRPGFYDHWHMDGSDDSTHEVLPYQNELTMPIGKGYMMALSSESMMMADGELNTGDIYTTVTVTEVGKHNPRPWRRYDEPWRTLNLVGNPYQSYLDFEKFVNDTRDDPNSNSDLLYCNSYATRDDKAGEFIFYTMEQSRNNRELMASRFIHPHQGFFIKVKAPGNLKFTDAMRVAGTNTSLGSDFRDINYPLVNLICYEPSGHRDFTTVEVNRPELGGGSKMQNLRTGNASIYAHFEDNDYQTLFTPMGVSTVPVWFETEEDGVFTLRWNTLHGDFNYLHLIDHIMGTDIDCLTTDEYIFEAKTSDYESRFKLVFDCVGVEEYEEDDLNSAAFAFQMGDELVINGEGMLQMFDISGRCLMSTQTMGQQSSVSLPKTAAGLYLLRLTTDSQVKVQKMVIK
ncbi:MAG: T9SS type A sorting domain-containing protein [Bacteroidales bacterium]|nr:T9SS type A sorting domain-containing protein [Bacteroidales bacterium]MBR6929650.1 T9SS type A sorting domain-containing protein [Bacteroidales bacterium]